VAARTLDTFFSFNRAWHGKCETANHESSSSGNALMGRAILEFHLQPRDFGSRHFYCAQNAKVPIFRAGAVGPWLNLQ